MYCLKGYYCGTGVFHGGRPVAGPTIYQKENESPRPYGRGTPAKLELAWEFGIVQFSSDQPQ